MKRFVLFFGVLLFLYSCNTARDYSINSDITVIEEIGDVTLVVEYMDMEKLKKEVSGTINPFVDVYDSLGKRIVVFKLRGSSEKTKLAFNYSDVGLTVNDSKITYADPLFVFMTNYTGNRLFHSIQDVARKYILPDRIKIAPEKPVEGYLVFVDWYPKLLTEAKLLIPAETEDGQAGLIKIDLPLKQIEELILKEQKIKDSSEDPDSIFFEPKEEQQDSNRDSAE